MSRRSNPYAGRELSINANGGERRRKGCVDYGIVASCEAWLGGAGKIATQVLRELTKAGLSVDVVSLETPHLYANVPGPMPFVHCPPQVTAGAVKPDVLIPFRLAETIARVAAVRLASGLRVTIWGTYLMPYGAASHLAASMLRDSGHDVRLVISPAGSDVWQLAPQLHEVSRHLLFGPSVDARLTYTRQFAQEIQTQFGVSASIDAVFPILDRERFRPASPIEREQARKVLGIGQAAFVLCCHCNMRPVKRPHIVVALAEKVATSLPATECILLMVGPIPSELANAQTGPANLRVVWTGVTGRVERELYASDVALNWSAHDSFNGSLMEAMAVGLPVVTTNVVGIGPEIVTAGAGALFADDQLEQACAYISELAIDRRMRDSVGLAAATHAAQVFSAERLVPRYLQVLTGNT